ncbi:Spy/CpxP family protein refolding chaperone [Desulfolucanica intricata]|uniref:Spy/CpxP family protein refolding chaperone n=1 Tax=Desulfolucanica intricata TaxID=1285191 RepID=UPI000836E961|nr:Spy/CpxP family protein refolding chaperone [Desulfolucanica intricata]
MKRKMGILIIAVFLVFSIASIASAAGLGAGGGGPRMLSNNNWVNPVDALNLTGEQITKMREIRQNTYEKTRDIKIKLMDSTFQLRQLQLQKNPDQAMIDAKIAEINDLRSKLSSITRESRQQCLSLLTQEQLAQMAKSGFCKMGAYGGFAMGIYK